MNISEINIDTILPQQSPFIMIDKLIRCDNVITETTFLLSNDNLFIYNGVFQESGIIENIAQTCAARMGYINSVINSIEIKVGFIGAIKELSIHSLPKTGDILNTSIEVKNEVLNFILIDAKVKVNNTLIAECEMKIFEQ